jgi:sugar/nucleoside kinase (ribokinase family)
MSEDARPKPVTRRPLRGRCHSAFGDTSDNACDQVFIAETRASEEDQAMSERKGIVTGGTWCLDLNKVIAKWPAEETASEIFELELHGGGSACNFAIDMRKLDPGLSVETIGLIGADANGDFLVETCDAVGISRQQLRRTAAAPTNFSDAYSVQGTGRRTHIYYPGASALLTPDHFEFDQTNGRICHLGLPGVHRIMDAPWPGHANGWAATLVRAQRAGLETNLELVSIERERLAALVLPCLPHLDLLVANEYEIGALAGEAILRDGLADVRAAVRAAKALLLCGSMKIVVVHFPMGAVAVTRNGEVSSQGSVRVPDSEVIGANGAGDAFAAGFVYGYQEGWDLAGSLALAHAAAAASMRSLSTTHGLDHWRACLARARSLGWRDIGQ